MSRCTTCDGHGAVCDACESPLTCWHDCETCGGQFCASLSRDTIISHSHNGGPEVAGGTCPDCRPLPILCWDRHQHNARGVTR
jgi:hypothetical protein